mmetsp:Transcript_4176/g.4770  ORF Transcript_4176/g.4770 Transcript_4176/m.4770 type:complete len:89 (-) Transcript_4176:217-483(-)
MCVGSYGVWGFWWWQMAGWRIMEYDPCNIGMRMDCVCVIYLVYLYSIVLGISPNINNESELEMRKKRLCNQRKRERKIGNGVTVTNLI